MQRACILEWKGDWDSHLALAEFAYNNSYHASIRMALYEALYGRPYRSPIHWGEVGERTLDSPFVFQYYTEQVHIIKKKRLTAQSRQKSYAGQRCRDLTFAVGDKVFIKVSPTKSVFYFGKKGKLNPRFVGPFEVLSQIGQTAYRVALPPQYVQIHNVFHVSMLRKYVHDPSHVIQHEDIEIQKDMTMKERPVEIMDRREQVLRTKVIPLVKVRWQHHGIDDCTWEPKSDMWDKYPQLFTFCS